MHHKLHRIFLPRIKPRRTQNKPLHLSPLRPRKPEPLQRSQIKLIHESIIDVCEFVTINELGKCKHLGHSYDINDAHNLIGL